MQTKLVLVFASPAQVCTQSHIRSACRIRRIGKHWYKCPKGGRGIAVAAAIVKTVAVPTADKLTLPNLTLRKAAVTQDFTLPNLMLRKTAAARDLTLSNLMLRKAAGARDLTLPNRMLRADAAGGIRDLALSMEQLWLRILRLRRIAILQR